MTDFVLPVELVQRLERTAEQENLTPAQLVERLLNEHLQTAEEDYTLADFGRNSEETDLHSLLDEEAPLGTLAALAQAARRANLPSGKPVDTSSRVNEIMNAEFADYVRRNVSNG